MNNAARAEVYRPLPGEAAKDVTVTVTLTDTDSGVSASRSFLIAVQPLTQQEIDAELALMAAVKAHYFDGIRNGNTDAKNILTDLHPFRGVSGCGRRLVWVYERRPDRQRHRPRGDGRLDGKRAVAAVPFDGFGRYQP